MTDNLEMNIHQLGSAYINQQLDQLQQLHPELQAQVQAQIQLQSQLQIQKQIQERIQQDFQARIQAQNLVPLQSQSENQQLEQPLQTIPLPPAPSLSPLSSLSQFGQVPQHQITNGPFDSVLNVPFNTPPTPQQQASMMPIGLGNPYMDLFNAQLPLITPFFNALLPLGLSPLAYMPLQSSPVPLMSLRIPTPPMFRAHPYQRERIDEMLRRTKERNDALYAINGKQANRSHAVPPRVELERLGEVLRKEADLSEREDSWRKRR